MVGISPVRDPLKVSVRPTPVTGKNGKLSLAGDAEKQKKRPLETQNPNFRFGRQLRSADSTGGRNRLAKSFSWRFVV